MTDASLPEPRAPDPETPVEPAALVLPAVSEPPLDERAPWLEHREIVDAIRISGAETPAFLTADGVAITTTGIGKSDAATTVAALLASPGFDLDSAYVLSAGIAGASPETAAFGSVVVGDAVVDWDRKHRWDRGERGDEPSDSIAPLVYRPRDYVYHLDDRLVECALGAARSVDLRENDDARAAQRRYPAAVDGGPTVERGTTVCGDEFWHGPRYAREVEWLCRRYGVGPYATTQMEDAATATALERFGLLDRYLSVRAVTNYDRPAPLTRPSRRASTAPRRAFG
jgi:purine nucleoside permease